jgi:hypothetical protein
VVKSKDGLPGVFAPLGKPSFFVEEMAQSRSVSSEILDLKEL